MNLTLANPVIQASCGHLPGALGLVRGVGGPAWAGVLPVVQRYDQPLAAPDLRDGIPLPASVEGLLSG